MDISDSTEEPIQEPHKYRRVFPIIGLLFFYLGVLIVSLDVVNGPVFVMQCVIFSVILIVSLQWPMNKAAVILGAIMVIVGSAGPIAEFLLSIQGGIISYSALGGSLAFIGVIFQIGTIIIWLVEPGKFIP